MTLSVSCVIPVWNGARHLREAIDSVLNQSRHVDQVIVVDDGSTDETPAILEAYGTDIHVVTQRHTGVAAAVNVGIRACTRELVTFCDADDLLTQQAVELRTAVLETSQDVDAVFGQVEQFVSPEVPTTAAQRFRFISGAVNVRLLGTMVARRDVFDEHGWFEESRVAGAAVEWMIHSHANGLRSTEIEVVVLRRRLHETNLSRTTGRDGNRDLLAIVRDHRRRQQSSMS
jgi:glycosyltransferase involved in cell wall biosynthesis